MCDHGNALLQRIYTAYLCPDATPVQRPVHSPRRDRTHPVAIVGDAVAARIALAIADNMAHRGTFDAALARVEPRVRAAVRVFLKTDRSMLYVADEVARVERLRGGPDKAFLQGLSFNAHIAACVRTSRPAHFVYKTMVRNSRGTHVVYRSFSQVRQAYAARACDAGAHVDARLHWRKKKKPFCVSLTNVRLSVPFVNTHVRIGCAAMDDVI